MKLLKVAAFFLATAGISSQALADNTLTTWEKLNWGETLNSDNGYYQLKMQWDGNLVLYETIDGAAIWSSNTSGNPMLKDGNGYLQMTDKGSVGLRSKLDGSTFKMYWNSDTWDSSGAHLIVKNNGRLLVVEPDGDIAWNSREGEECWTEIRDTWAGVDAPAEQCHFTKIEQQTGKDEYVEMHLWKELTGGSRTFTEYYDSQWGDQQCTIADLHYSGPAAVEFCNGVYQKEP